MFFLHFAEKRQRGRLAGFSVYASNTGVMDSSSLCNDTRSETLPPLNITITCIKPGRYIIFYNERLDGVKYPEEYEATANVFMELCEVIVLGNYHISNELFIVLAMKKL